MKYQNVLVYANGTRIEGKTWEGKDAKQEAEQACANMNAALFINKAEGVTCETVALIGTLKPLHRLTRQNIADFARRVENRENLNKLSGKVIISRNENTTEGGIDYWYSGFHHNGHFGLSMGMIRWGDAKTACFCTEGRTLLEAERNFLRRLVEKLVEQAPSSSEYYVFDSMADATEFILEDSSC